MFTWLATIAAVGIMTALALTCVAAPVVIRRQARAGRRAVTDPAARWRWRWGSGLGAAAGAVLVGVMVWNLGSLLGVDPGSPKRLVLPLLLASVVAAGAARAWWLRARRRAVYRGIGAGKPHPLDVLDERLARIEV